jgi:hypothetical protein
MTLKCLRGFLGLTGYYRKIFHHYGKFTKPLTYLLKKNAFHLTPTAQQSFTVLKRVMCTTHALTTPDFKKTFVVESDASRTGIGTIIT